MAKLDKSDVKHVAKLANLKLEDKEVDVFLPQLSSIVGFIESLDEVDTDGIEPTSQTTGLYDVFRNDEVKVTQILSQDSALSGSEDTHNGYFKVSAILSERSDK